MGDEISWKRLAETVATRRVEVIGSRDKAAAASGVGRQTWYDLERGVERDYGERSRNGIMRALGWTTASWDLILNGAEPAIRSSPAEVGLDRRIAVLAAELRAVLEAQTETRRLLDEVREDQKATRQFLDEVLRRLPPVPQSGR